MSPAHKLTSCAAEIKGNLRICPYCGFPRSWKHGKYKRKGFHRPGPEVGPQELVEIQRYWCRNAVCERTFSILPEGVLPYCRFWWRALLGIANSLTQGQTPYAIAKVTWGLPLGVVLRASELIRKVTPWLEGLCREVTGSAVAGLAALAETALRSHSWPSFTRRWFHGFYPRRIRPIFNPHNLDIKRL